ncbi:MAG: LysR family transcriptional regulator [Bacteroidales bacterium]|nr:LysR family transcriptional regulator [Bacteroidales bacterium]
MNFNQLQYFTELVLQGSFTKAANRLGISQPALSQQINKLEQELNYKLIDRLKKPLVLTPEGEVLLERIEEVTKLMDSLKDIAIELEETIKGELKVGIIPTLAPYFVPMFINDINQRYPGLKLIVEEVVTEDILSNLKLGELDAGIISTPVKVSGIQFTPLFYERFFLYISDRHPLFSHEEINLNEFDLHDLWYLKEGNCFQNQVNELCSLAKTPVEGQNLVYYSNSIESLRRIVETRKGMTFIPELATAGVAPEYEDMVKPIAGNQPLREISLAVSRVHSKKKLLDRFVEVVLDNLPERMKTKPESGIVSTNLSF